MEGGEKEVDGFRESCAFNISAQKDAYFNNSKYLKKYFFDRAVFVLPVLSFFSSFFALFFFSPCAFSVRKVSATFLFVVVCFYTNFVLLSSFAFFSSSFLYFSSSQSSSSFGTYFASASPVRTAVQTAVEEQEKPLVSELYAHEIKTLEEFDERVRQSSKIEIVMFYANWCPHCHQYSSTFRRIARNWFYTKSVRFNLVDCAGGTLGVDVCNIYNIDAYPSVRVLMKKNTFENFITSNFTKQSDEVITRGEYDGKNEGKKKNENESSYYLQQLELHFLEFLPPGPFQIKIEGGYEASHGKQYHIVVPFTHRKLDEFNDFMDKCTPVVRTPPPYRDDLKYALGDPSAIGGSAILNGEELFVSENERKVEEGKNDDDLNVKEENELLSMRSKYRWNAKANEMSPENKLHDATYGILYLLRNWVFIGRKKLNETQQNALINLLELCRYAFPGEEMKLSFHKLILFVHNISHNKDAVYKHIEKIKNEYKGKDEEGGKKIVIEGEILKETFTNKKRNEEIGSDKNKNNNVRSSNNNGKTIDYLELRDWNMYMNNFSIGNIGPLKIGERPPFAQCDTLLCSIWVLFHFLSVSSHNQFNSITKYFGHKNTYLFKPNESFSLFLRQKYEEQMQRNSSPIYDLIGYIPEEKLTEKKKPTSDDNKNKGNSEKQTAGKKKNYNENEAFAFLLSAIPYVVSPSSSSLYITYNSIVDSMSLPMDPVLLLPFFPANIPSASAFSPGVSNVPHGKIAATTKHMLSILTKEVGGAVYSAYDVMQTIRETVKNFFACSVCHEHFLLAYDTCAFERCLYVHPAVVDVMKQLSNNNNKEGGNAHGDVTVYIPKSRKAKNNEDEALNFEYLVLYLWRFHNAVTVRTAVERTAEFVAMKRKYFEENSSDINNENMNSNNNINGGRANGSQVRKKLLREFKEAVYEEAAANPGFIVNYIGVDPQWPSADACRTCRKKNNVYNVFFFRMNIVDPYYNDAIRNTRSNVSANTNNSVEPAPPSKYDLTIPLTLQDIKLYEEKKLGLNDYDIYKHFNTPRILKHLHNSYYDSEWAVCLNLSFNKKNNYYELEKSPLSASAVARCLKKTYNYFYDITEDAKMYVYNAVHSESNVPFILVMLSVCVFIVLFLFSYSGRGKALYRYYYRRRSFSQLIGGNNKNEKYIRKRGMVHFVTNAVHTLIKSFASNSRESKKNINSKSSYHHKNNHKNNHNNSTNLYNKGYVSSKSSSTEDMFENSCFSSSSSFSFSPSASTFSGSNSIQSLPSSPSTSFTLMKCQSKVNGNNSNNNNTNNNNNNNNNSSNSSADRCTRKSHSSYNSSPSSSSPACISCYNGCNKLTKEQEEEDICKKSLSMYQLKNVFVFKFGSRKKEETCDSNSYNNNNNNSNPPPHVTKNSGDITPKKVDNSS